MTEFTQRYKSLTNTELLLIIAESERYQSLAVETARKEIEDRQLSDEALEESKLETESILQNKREKAEKSKNQEDNIKAKITSFLDMLNPIQIGAKTDEKIITSIVVIFALFSISRIYKEFGLLYFLFFDDEAKWDLSVVKYFFPLVLLSIGTFLFWKRKKLGWILLSFYLTYSATSVIGLFLMDINRKSSGIAVLDSFFPKIPTSSYILSILFFGVMLCILCKKEIRKRYQITNRNMLLTIGLTIVLDVIFIFSIVS